MDLTNDSSVLIISRCFMAKIVHVNLCVVCAFNDCDVLHFTMFLLKFLS